MDSPAERTNFISVGKEVILEKYKELDIFFNASIRLLYGEVDSNLTVANHTLETVYTNGEKNNLSVFSMCKNKVGIYIFLNNGLPEYIGKGGTSRRREKGKDLKFRIGQELGPYNGNGKNTLSKNVIDYNRQNHNQIVNGAESIETIRSFNLLLLIVGDRVVNGEINSDAIAKTEALETMLLYLFKTRFNK